MCILNIFCVTWSMGRLKLQKGCGDAYFMYFLGDVEREEIEFIDRVCR